MHSDFKLVERGADRDDQRLAATRQALRRAYELPKDTFVTADLPLLLTTLALRPEEPRGSRATSAAAAVMPPPMPGSRRR